MSEYTTPPFTSLPPVDGLPDCRWVGSTIMGAEQFSIEGWACAVIGTTTYWRASLRGLEAYADLAERRRKAEARGVAWEEAPEAYEVDETLWRGQP